MIEDVDYKTNSFSVVLGNKKTYFYLTNRLAKIFMPHLNDNLIVDFVITKRTRNINNVKHHQIKHFNYIKNYKTDFVLYDHNKLKVDMIDFLESQNYFLFLDLEMTMPNYYQKKFIPEIIQYGYYLVDDKGNILNKHSNYLETKLSKRLNKQTIRFLNLDVGNYHNVKLPFSVFYNELKNIIQKYNPI